MDKMGYPHGLIRYSTQNAIDGKPSRVLRPRMLVYGALLLVLVAGWAWGIAARSPLIVDVLRDRNALYRVVDDGVDNGYTLKLVNKTQAAQVYTVALAPADAGITLRGGEQTVAAEAGEVLSIPVELSAPADTRGRHEVRFVVESADGSVREVADSTFFGPI